MVVKTVISNSTKIFKGLCTPAQIEIVLSIIGISSLIISCLTNTPGNKFQIACIDAIPYSIVSIIFVFILNALCKGGAKIISWILVLAPLISILFTIFTQPYNTEHSKMFKIENFSLKHMEAFKDGTKIRLKRGDKYIRMFSNGKVGQGGAGKQEIFTVKALPQFGDNCVALFGWTNKFLNIQDNKKTVSQSSRRNSYKDLPSNWEAERWFIEDVGKGQIALRSNVDTYLFAGNGEVKSNGIVIAKGKTIPNSWLAEKFTAVVVPLSKEEKEEEEEEERKKLEEEEEERKKLEEEERKRKYLEKELKYQLIKTQTKFLKNGVKKRIKIYKNKFARYGWKKRKEYLKQINKIDNGSGKSWRQAWKNDSLYYSPVNREKRKVFIIWYENYLQGKLELNIARDEDTKKVKRRKKNRRKYLWREMKQRANIQKAIAERQQEENKALKEKREKQLEAKARGQGR